MKALCVGGQMDGYFVEYDDSDSRLYFDFPAPFNGVAPNVDEKGEKAETHRVYRYKIHAFHCGQYAKRYFFAPVEYEDDPVFVIDRLITGYHRI